MNTIFFLVKFFREAEYAAEFVDGKLFCNTLSAFKKMEGTDDSGRADRSEGTTLWLQPGEVNLVLNDMDLSNDLAGPLQIQMESLDYFHLFCMHACHTGALDVGDLLNGDIEVLRQELMVPLDCLKLGEYVVVVKDVPGFISRVAAAVKENGYEGGRGLVKYYDPETFHGSFRGIDPAFRKQVMQSYQREFRIVIATGSVGDSPLTLDVGDLSDITIPLLASELNGPKLLGGELALQCRR